MEDLNRWPSDSNAVHFLSMTTSTTSITALRKVRPISYRQLSTDISSMHLLHPTGARKSSSGWWHWQACRHTGATSIYNESVVIVPAYKVACLQSPSFLSTVHPRTSVEIGRKQLSACGYRGNPIPSGLGREVWPARPPAATGYRPQPLRDYTL